MSRDTDPIWMSGPPEPRCARCDAYIDEDDFDDDSEESWRCRKCGWDGVPDRCVVCKAAIGPKDENFGTSLCKTCEMWGHEADREAREEYLMRVYGLEEDAHDE